MKCIEEKTNDISWISDVIIFWKKLTLKLKFWDDIISQMNGLKLYILQCMRVFIEEQQQHQRQFTVRPVGRPTMHAHICSSKMIIDKFRHGHPVYILLFACLYIMRTARTLPLLSSVSFRFVSLCFRLLLDTDFNRSITFIQKHLMKWLKRFVFLQSPSVSPVSVPQPLAFFEKYCVLVKLLFYRMYRIQKKHWNL